MIRFCKEAGLSQRDYALAAAREPLRFCASIWEEGRERCRYFPRGSEDRAVTPVLNERGETVCFSYQDNEANRELRMLRELRQRKDALQFPDVFPEYCEVLLCGCNELAAAFAEYLRELGVTVSVVGDYWEYFGWESSWEAVFTERKGRLVVYAEGLAPSAGGAEESARRSVSPEFECVDKIYEANVREGRIRDTDGGADGFFEKLRGERELLIMGTGERAQDAYDLLMAHGIDILGFAVETAAQDTLLGKRILTVSDAMRQLRRPVFLNCDSAYGALGGEWTEFFDYRGYERNEQYFLLRDYAADIPTSNLVHVLRGKRVLLAGDPILCDMLIRYLTEVENGQIEVRYIAWGKKVPAEPGDIRCLVVPDYRTGEKGTAQKRAREQRCALAEMSFENYSEYFVSCKPFALIDVYFNQGKEKYSIPELCPKGILLGRIPGASGNYFLRGVMDGHPDILEIPYSDFNNNLFYYCVRLANVDPGEVLNRFWEIYGEESDERKSQFKDLEGFESSMRRYLKRKEAFTAQELFVMFHLACVEMVKGDSVQDIDRQIIYWEPHFIDRDVFPFFALWLESGRIDGQTVVLRRDNIVRTGSACKRKSEGHWGNPYANMILDDTFFDNVQVRYHHWTEFKMRFEDIKLHPRETLGKLCSRLGIAWSDSMLRTTRNGEQPLAYRGSADFDLKAVFNRYEDFLSEFDRFRVSITSGLYQKRFGYPYESCLNFSRRELQELFLKPFLFEKVFGENGVNHTGDTEWFAWRLWHVRKRMLLNTVHPEFGPVELKQTGEALVKAYFLKHFEGGLKAAVDYARGSEKLVIYGTGCDCKGLLGLMDDGTKQRAVYCDKKAVEKPYLFEGREVVPPAELCGRYQQYRILVTSSQYGREIEKEFNERGIDPGRVFYNTVEFGAISC